MDKKLALTVAIVCLNSLSAFSPSQEKKPDPPIPPAAQKLDEPKKDPKVEEYEKAVKELKRIDGNFTLYQRKKEVLLELPESKLGQLFLIQGAFNTGVMADGIQAGFPIGFGADDVFRFERNEETVMLVRPNLRYRWTKDDPLAVASARSFPEAYLASFKIEQTNPEKKLLLINLTNLFLGDVFHLSEAVSGSLGGPYMLDREKSGPESIKGFPENDVVQMKMHFVNPRGGGGGGDNPLAALLGAGGNQLEDERSAPLKVTYNFWWRHDSGYMPRMSDPRVGFFTQDYYSVDRFLNDDRTVRYINRFNLKKRDPNAKVSEPVKPIIWVVDDSVPANIRPAVREGILRWNKAFDALGYKNAVQVIDTPKDATYDHADGRYNVVRFTMSEDAGYAIALARTDPFTGEVLNASVTMDAHMFSYAAREHDTLGAAAMARERAALVLTRAANVANPDNFLWRTDREAQQELLVSRMSKFGWLDRSCHLPEGLSSSAAFGWDALSAYPSGIAISKEKYANQYVADVISHEVGHCLGLRHNFIGSTNLTTAQLANDSLTGAQGITASVMDYVPVNIMAILKGSGNFFTPCIGPYDQWAIQYGYTDVRASSPVGERPDLAQIASLSGVGGHRFMTDENADTWDPFVVRFDNAKDPILYSAQMLTAINRLRNYAINSMTKPGESYARRNQTILSGVSMTIRQARLASRFIGGVAGNRNFKGDAGEQPTLAPVNAADQRAAIKMITKSCFAPDSFALPASVLNSLAFDYNQGTSSAWNAPLRDIIGANQNSLLASLMSASTTDRITENTYKTGSKGDAYTVSEHYANLISAVFGEIGLNRNLTPLRRDLQRFALSGLITQASAPQGGINDDVRVVAADWLRRIGQKIAKQQSIGKLDDLTRLHLRDCQESIQRFLVRQYSK